jgi:hypothetical protein
VEGAETGKEEESGMAGFYSRKNPQQALANNHATNRKGAPNPRPNETP